MQRGYFEVDGCAGHLQVTKLASKQRRASICMSKVSQSFKWRRTASTCKFDTCKESSETNQNYSAIQHSILAIVDLVRVVDRNKEADGAATSLPSIVGL